MVSCNNLNKDSGLAQNLSVLTGSKLNKFT